MWELTFGAGDQVLEERHLAVLMGQHVTLNPLGQKHLEQAIYYKITIAKMAISI